MDVKEKWTIYLILLVAGFTTGIGSLLNVPVYWLQYGATWMFLYLVFLALFMYIAIREVEWVRNLGYNFGDVYRKILKRPELMFVILAVIILLLSTEPVYMILIPLSIIRWTYPTPFSKLMSKLLVIGLMFLVLRMGRKKTLEISAITSLILGIILILLATGHLGAFYLKRPYQWHMMTVSMIVTAFRRALYGSGLGFAFYLLMGNIIDEKFNGKFVVGTGIVVHVLMVVLFSCIAFFALFYRILIFNPNTHITSGHLIYALHGGLGPLASLLASFSILLAGITFILPAAEAGVQILKSSFGMDRDKAIMYLAGASLIAGVLDISVSVENLLWKVFIALIISAALCEFYPVIALRGTENIPGDIELETSLDVLAEEEVEENKKQPQPQYEGMRTNSDLLMIKEVAKDMDKTQRILFYESKKRNPALMALLSLLIPGLGQMIQGRVLRGVLILVFSWTLVVPLWGIYDSYKLAKEYNQQLFFILFSDNEKQP